MYVDGNPVGRTDDSGLLIGGLVNAGESYGDYATQYWVSKYVETGNSAYLVPGWVASRWTTESSDTTFTFLLNAYFGGKAATSSLAGEGPYWRYVGPKSKPDSPWMTRGKCPPYGKNFDAAKDALQMPYTPNNVKKVDVPWYRPVKGPRPVIGKPEWGSGGGQEYYRGWRWPE